MTAQNGLYATKRTFSDLQLPLSTLKIRSYTIFRLAESTETLPAMTTFGHRIAYTIFRLAESTETEIDNHVVSLVEPYTIFRLAESTETLALLSAFIIALAYTIFRLAESTETC